jgi:hypothetical protein
MRQHTSAYVSIRQHTSACVSIRQHTSAYVSTRQHTSAYVSTRQLFLHVGPVIGSEHLKHAQHRTEEVGKVFAVQLGKKPVCT